jgi:hypothetical protein
VGQAGTGHAQDLRFQFAMLEEGKLCGLVLLRFADFGLAFSGLLIWG